MHRKWIWIAMVGMAVGGGGGAGVMDAQGQVRRPPNRQPPAVDNRDTCQQGMDAVAQKKYELGIRLLETFLNSSAGDPRAEKATKMMHDARIALARDLAGSGQEIEACGHYLKLAEEAPAFKENRETYVKQALSTLQAGFADAQKRKLYDKLLDVEKAWKQYFPEKPGLLSAEEIETAKMDAVIAGCEDKFNQLTLPDLVERYYGSAQPPWEELAKKNKGQPVMGMYFRALAEVGWAGRYIAEYQRLEADSPVRGEKHFAQQTERMFLRRCESAMLLGNLPEARKAIAAARGEITTPSSQSALRAMEVKLPPDVSDALGGGREKKLRDLSFNAPIVGKVKWNDKGEGFGEAKDVWLEDGSEVTVMPGLVLNGGKITLKRARMKLAGTPNQPIIFRNVQFNGELGAHLETENAILENCTFSKTGGWFSMHSSRWEFTDTILYRCRFSGLKQIDYGVQMTNCAWIEGTMPHREPGKTVDLAAAFSGRWDKMTSCLFLRSRISLSAIWMSRNCNFVRCTTGQEDFVSKTSLAIPLYAPEGDLSARKLQGWTVEGDVGQVAYGVSRKAFEVKVPPVLWGLLPVELAGRKKD